MRDSHRRLADSRDRTRRQPISAGEHPRVRRNSTSARNFGRLSGRTPLGRSCGPVHAMGGLRFRGRYPLPSPAHDRDPRQVAGVATTFCTCPIPAPEIMGIAKWLGITHLFQMGGAQAIAALAYGTETGPRSTESSDPATFTSRLQRN